MKKSFVISAEPGKMFLFKFLFIWKHEIRWIFIMLKNNMES